MRDKRLPSFLICLAGYFIVGCMVLTINTSVNSMITEYHWTDSQGGLLVSFLSVGNLIMTLFSGFVHRKLGWKGCFVVFPALIAVGMVAMAVTHSMAAAYAAVLVCGLCWGSLNSLISLVISDLYNGSVARLTICNTFYSIGAVVMPLLISLCISMGSTWRIPALITAVMSGVVAVAAGAAPLPRGTNKVSRQEQTEAVAYWKEPGFYLGFAMFFLYVGVETAASAWLAGYLAQVNTFFSRIPSETMVSVMWGMMIVGRLILASVGGNVNKGLLLTVLSAGFLIGMIGVVYFSASTPLAVFFVAFTGFSMSGLYSTCTANNTRYITCSPVSQGVIIGGSGLGSAMIPWLAGVVSDNAGMKNGMLLLVMFLIALLVVSVLSMRENREQAA